MAVQPKDNNPNGAADRGAVKTKAPAQRFVVEDRTGMPEPARQSGYGRNQAALPSSVPPGSYVRADLDIGAPDGDAVLDAIKAQGVHAAAATDWQTRGVDTLGKGHVAINRDTIGAAPGPKVPGTLVADQGEPERQP